MAAETESAALSNRSGAWGQTLATGVVFLAALTVLQRVVGLGRSLVICDWLPTGELGKWDLYFTFLMAAGPLVVLGLPGALGRFAEGYRASGRVARFIQITSAACLTLFLISAVGLYLGRHQVSRILLNSDYQAEWFWVLLPVLSIVVVYNYLTALMNALRLHRGFAGVQATQGIAFAVLCMAVVPLWGFRATGVLAAYGLACVVSSVVALASLRRTFTTHGSAAESERSEAAAETNDAVRFPSFVTELGSLIRTILPFACALWLATLVSNGFRISDRMLMLHLSANEEIALYFIGQYHAARIIPQLMTHFAISLSGMITPHLVQDWDRGDSGRAVNRLASLLKLVSIGFSIASVLVLTFAPWLFSLLMNSKFDVALDLLPWSMASGVTFSLAFIVQNVFWCSRKAWWTSLAFAVGLVVNVLVGMTLYPHTGIVGVVIATFLATTATLWTMLLIADQNGFRFSLSTYLWLALPAALAAGTFGCGLIAIAVLLAIAMPDTLTTADERSRLRELLVDRLPFSVRH